VVLADGGGLVDSLVDSRLDKREEKRNVYVLAWHGRAWHGMAWHGFSMRYRYGCVCVCRLGHASQSVSAVQCGAFRWTGVKLHIYGVRHRNY